MGTAAQTSGETSLYYVMPPHRADRPRRHVTWLESQGSLSPTNLAQSAVFDSVTEAMGHYPSDTVFDIRDDRMRKVASVVVGPSRASEASPT